MALPAGPGMDGSGRVAPSFFEGLPSELRQQLAFQPTQELLIASSLRLEPDTDQLASPLIVLDLDQPPAPQAPQIQGVRL